MMHNATKQILATAILSAFAVSANAWEPGRFTGGGFLNCEYNGETFKATFGYELHCQTDGSPAPSSPNNLQVNFLGGNHFHLTNLTTSQCFEPSTTTPTAGVSVMTGSGTGVYNGAPAAVNYTITDVSEPGRLDTIALTITLPAGPVISCTGMLPGGNNQAHDATGSKQ